VILEAVSADDWPEVECKWIGALPDLVNTHRGGDPRGGQTGVKRSAETRRRLSDAAKRRGPLPAETRAKISASLAGRPRPKAVRERISRSKTGKPNGHEGQKRSAETRRKISVGVKSAHKRGVYANLGR
jgi:hypothetical protein